MENSVDTIADFLSRYTATLSYDDLPQEVVHEVKRRVIDALGCAVGAFTADPGQIARRVASSVRATPGATILGATQKSSSDLAAFANGTLIRYLDYNDTYLSKEPAHPSDNIAPALAVAETERADGKSLITAIVIGYEVQCRLCDAASLRVSGWDHVTYGAFSTSLLASQLMGLSEEATRHALGLAGTPNITLRQTRAGELSMWKGCAFANASRNGVFAATLAKHGMTGPAPIFEGVFGFQKLVSGPFSLAPFGGKDHPFKILDTSIKHFPVEYHAQSAVEAALALRKEIKEVGDITTIETIHVETFDAAVQIIAGEPEKWHPKSRETADHSLPYCVAVALMDGEVGLRQFDEERIADPVLHNLIQKVEVAESAELNRIYPEGIPNDIEIVLKSGERYRKRVDYPLGHDKNPMCDEEVEEKFRKLARPYFPARRVDRILQKIWRLEEVTEVGGLLSLFALE